MSKQMVLIKCRETHLNLCVGETGPGTIGLPFKLWGGDISIYSSFDFVTVLIIYLDL